MPVIVVGADTPTGSGIIAELARSGGEVRAFVTDPAYVDGFRSQHCKVALGDVSDGSHIEMAAFECFAAVLITEAAADERERSFAAGAEAVAAVWLKAIRAAGIHRLIWVGSPLLPEPPTRPANPEVAIVSQDDEAFAQEVARLNELETLP